MENEIKSGRNFKDTIENLQNGGKPLVFTVIVTFAIVIVACLAVFFASMQGAEKVMVPNVVGKDLKTALMEMQAKELYAKIQLKYADDVEKDQIIAQTPDAGAIVRAYRRVTLTVSKGFDADQVGDYTGKDIDDVLQELKSRTTGRSLLKVQEPVYQKDSSAKGTILAQTPEAGTVISDATNLQFIVSSGNTADLVKVPNITGMNIDQVYKAMQNNKIIFDFTSHVAFDNEKSNTIVSEENPGGEVPEYSRIKADFAFAQVTPDSKNINGIASPNVAEYPFPVKMILEATSREGETKSLVTFNHTGKSLTIPFNVERGTKLILRIKAGSTENTITIL